MQEILRRHSFSIAFGVIIFGYIFIFTGRGEVQQINGFTMGTTFQVQIVDMPRSLERSELVAELNDLLSRMDREVFSTYEPQSELSRLNRHPVGEPFPVSEELLEVLLLAREVSELSGGAFDITVGPLVNLWGFGPSSTSGSQPVAPGAAAIAAALDRVGYDKLLVDAGNGEVTRLADIYVDLSAIAKGYAVDELGEYLESLGVENYFLEIGGELKMRGWKPDQESWLPAIETPVEGAASVRQVIASNGDNIAIAGSGDYRNYFEADGRRYSHEIDPRTGAPVNHAMAAAYVLSDNAARADAMATAYMILGPEQGRSLASRLGQAVYFISRNTENEFEDYASTEFASYLQ